MFCPQCGTEISDIDRFCDKCGANLSIYEVEGASQSDNKKASAKAVPKKPTPEKTVGQPPATFSPAADNSAPPEKQDWGHIEVKAATWGTRIGVFIVVIGLGYLLSIGFGRIDLLPKAILVYTACVAMWVTGLLFERKIQYSTWGRIMIAGGWAGIYITTFLIHFLPEAQLITRPEIAMMFLIVVAAGMIAHSLWYKSQSLTTLTFFIAFATISVSIRIADMTYFCLAGTCLLGAAALVIFYRTRWYFLVLFSLVACYSAHVLWMHPLLDFIRPADAQGLELRAGLLALVAYWLIFSIAPFIVRPIDKKDSSVSVWISALNFVLFVMLFKYQASSGEHPEHKIYFTVVMAVVYAAKTIIAKLLKRDDLFPFMLAGAALMSTMALYFWQVGSELVTITWLLQAEALFFAGMLADERRLRLLSAANFALVVFWFFYRDWLPQEQVMVLGATMMKNTIVAGSVAVVFYINSIVRKAMAGRIESPDRFSHVFSYTASLLLLSVSLRNWQPENLLHMMAACSLFGLVLIESGLRLKDFHLRIQGLFFIISGILLAVVPLLFITDAYYLHGIYLRIGELAFVVAVSYYIFFRLLNADGDPDEAVGYNSISTLVAVAGTLVLFLVIRQELRFVRMAYVAVAWTVMSVILLEAGIIMNSRLFRVKTLAISGIIFFYALLHNLGPGKNVGPFSDRLISLVLVIAGLYYIYERFSAGAKREAEWADSDGIEAVLSWFAGILAGVLVFSEMLPAYPEWIGPVLVVPAAVLAVWGARRSDLNYLSQGFVFSLAIFIWHLWFVLMGMSDVVDQGAAAGSRLYSSIIIILFFYAAFGYIGMRKENVFAEFFGGYLGSAGDFFSWAASSLLAVLLFIELTPVSPVYATLAWGGAAILLLEAGLLLDKVSLKTQALFLLYACFLKIVLFDIQETHGEFWFTTMRALEIFSVALVNFYMLVRLRLSRGFSLFEIDDSRISDFLSYLGAAVFAVLIFSDVPRDYLPAAFACLMLVMLVTGLLVRNVHPVYISLIAVAPVIFEILRVGFNDGFTSAAVFSTYTALGLMFAARIIWFMGFKEYKGLFIMPEQGVESIKQTAMHFYSVPAALLLFFFLRHSFIGDLERYLTVSWAVMGLLLLVLGFGINDRIQRFAGLGVLSFCILKVFYDLWMLDIDRIYKVIALIGLGVILIVTGLIYSRYREKINRIL